MGISLNGRTPADTYPSIIKIGNNSSLSAELKALSDGNGTDSPLKLSTTAVGIGDIVNVETAINAKISSGSNVGGGTGIFAQASAGVMQFKTLISGTGISITSTSNTITINGGDASIALNDLTDVNIVGTPQNSQALVFDSTSSEWKNQFVLNAVDANEGLTITGNSLGTLYNSTIADAVNSVAVGGATAQPASFWKSKTLVQVLDTILFPTLLASIQTPKSISIGVSGSSGVLEVGLPVSRVLTATFNQGRIVNGDGTQGPLLVGSATSYTFTGTGISSTTQAGGTLDIGSVSVVDGTNNWAVTANHDAGTGAYYDNKGNAGTNLDASRVSGTVTDSSSSPSVTGVYPYFYLKSSSPITASSMASAIAAGTATKVVASSTGTLSIPYNMSAQYLAVAYPNASTTKTVYYVTALDNGAITLVFDPVTTQSVNSPNGYWSSQTYKIHVSKAAITNSNATIELRNS
jgi:hypothetical protein